MRESEAKVNRDWLAVVPGDPDKSNLYRAITYLDSELVMPPKSRLPKSVVADFKQWIEMGATDPRRWTH